MTLEELLNSLIQRGWKPFPNEWIDCYYFKFSNRWHDFMCCSSDDDDEYTHNYTYSWRDIASKESWLWQFVCKNGMIKNPNIERYWKDYFELDHIEYYQSDFQYWILESALCDEDKLEEFLLSNIKIEWEV